MADTGITISYSQCMRFFPSQAIVELIPPGFCCLLATGFRHFVGLWRQLLYMCGYMACIRTCPFATS
jgi:hypothetical protein